MLIFYKKQKITAEHIFERKKLLFGFKVKFFQKRNEF